MSTPATLAGSPTSSVRRFTGSPWTLLGYLADELAIRPRRVARAVRLALMTSVGIGLMAALHVESMFGPYLLWAVAAAPRAMMTATQAGALIVTEGVLLIAAVPLAGIFVEAPWLYVPSFAGLVAMRAFLFKRFNLSNAWLLVGVTALSTLYAVVFDPKGFGWDAASTFGGAVVAFGTILLFDAYLWPDPAEAELLDSIARDLDQTRTDLHLVGRAYFDRAARAATPTVPLRSAMSEFLPLLDRVAREGATASRRAQLLAIVTLTERLRMELARLHRLACAPVGDALRHLLRAQVEPVLGAIDSALATLAGDVRGGIDSTGERLAAAHDAIAAALADLDARSAALALHARLGVDPPELANIASFFLGLHAFARLLDKTAEYPRLSAAPSRPARPPVIDPETTRHALKLGVAMAAMLVIALTSQRPDMTAALWTVLIAGLPSHGATLRKLALRIAGVLIGGGIAIAAIAVVTPNFDTVLSYMIACFLVLVGCAWAAQTSSRIAYAGSQAGTTFVLVFAGLSPSARIYDPLWRIWAVLLGVGVTGTAFLLLWPDYAADSMLSRLRKLLEIDLRLLPSTAPPPDDAAIEALEHESTDGVVQLLGVADDARLEGTRSGVNADAIVDAAGTLRRIAHRLGWIAAGRPAQQALSPASEAARRTFEDALRQRIGAWRECFAAPVPDRGAAAAIRDRHRADDLEHTLQALVTRVGSDSYAEVAAWPLTARRALLAELESFDRLVVLSGELDQQFAAIMAA